MTTRAHPSLNPDAVPRAVDVESTQAHPILNPGASGEVRFGAGDMIRDLRVVCNLEGGGGQGDVYRCRGPADEEVVAKIYSRNIRPKQEVFEQLKGLKHPRVVAVIDGFDWQGHFCEVLEYCSEGSLLGRKLTEAEARQLIPPIVEGLQFLHTRNVIHRDIKPANLLLKAKSFKDVALADFGCSSYLKEGQSRQVSASHRNNTLTFAAPDLLTSLVGRECDYYSLGLTLICLVTGLDTPFPDAKDDAAIIGNHVFNRIPYPSSVSDSFRTLLVGLTQHSPENRWGYKQVECWLHGRDVLDNAGKPWRHRGSDIPQLTCCPSVQSLSELADSLDRIDDLQGEFSSIRDWVRRVGGDALAQRMQREVRFELNEDPRRALFLLYYLLKPDAPLEIGSGRMHEIVERTLKRNGIKPKSSNLSA